MTISVFEFRLTRAAYARPHSASQPPCRSSESAAASSKVIEKCWTFTLYPVCCLRKSRLMQPLELQQSDCIDAVPLSTRGESYLMRQKVPTEPEDSDVTVPAGLCDSVIHWCSLRMLQNPQLEHAAVKGGKTAGYSLRGLLSKSHPLCILTVCMPSVTDEMMSFKRDMQQFIEMKQDNSLLRYHKSNSSQVSDSSLRLTGVSKLS